MVERVGPGVREFAAGDRVIGSFFESWIGGEPSEAKMRRALGGSVDGVLSEYRIFPKHALVRTPEHLSDIEAAALPCAGVTAWSAVVKLGGVKPGQTVLTQGTGGVSLFATSVCQNVRRARHRHFVQRRQDRTPQAARRRLYIELQGDTRLGKESPRVERPRRRPGRRGGRGRHAERIDPGDQDRRHDRVHRRARRPAAVRTRGCH